MLNAPDTPDRLTRHAALDRRVAWRIAICALGFRVVSAVLGLFITLAFPIDRGANMMFAAASPFWDNFALTDAGWYQGIARFGYEYYVDSRSNIAFFPVFPLLMRYVGRPFGTSPAAYYFGGIIVSTLCFALAMVALFYLARLDLPRRIAARAVLLTAIFPFAFFFGMVYTESTFLLFTVLAFYLFRTRRWMLGGLCAAVAIATRVPGILMWPALAWIAWRAAEPNWRDRGWAAAGLVLSLAGFAWYCAFIYSVSGHPFEWVDTLQHWGYHVGGQPWTAPLHLLGNLLTHPYAYLIGDKMAPYDTLYGVTGMAFLVASVFVWRRFGAAYGMFMLLTLLLPLSSGVLEGVGRYCSVLFPCFIWLATVRSRLVSMTVAVVFALFYTLGFSLFLTRHPIF